MLRRKHCSAKGHAIKTAVPYGFEKVEYLESSGTQWMQVPITTNPNDEVTASFYGNFTNITTYQEEGYQVAQHTSPYFQIGVSNGKWCGGVRSFVNDSGIEANTNEHLFEIVALKDYCGVVIDKNTIIKQSPITQAPITVRMGLWRSVLPNMLYPSLTYNRKKTYKINVNNKFVYDLIPVLDRTGTPCMFDKVTRKRFYNSGSGEFSYPRPNNIPSNYTPVEYLENPYKTYTNDYAAYFDLGRFDVDLQRGDVVKFETIHQIPNIPDSNWTHSGSEGFYEDGTSLVIEHRKSMRPVGGGVNDTATWNGWCSAYDTAGGAWGTWDWCSFKPNQTHDTNWHTIILEHSKDVHRFQLDDFVTESETRENKRWAGSPLLFVFGVKQTGGYYPQRPLVGRKKYFKFWINGILTRNLIPCLDPTGTPCMFDTVTQKPFYNSGTGDFLYPSPTSAATYSMRRPQAEYAKMTETGIRRLYHVPADYDGSIEEYANEHSFKLLIETESPNEEGKYYAFRWVETDTELRTEWYETEPPTDELGNPIENTDEQQASTFNLQRPAPIDTTVYSNTATWAMMTDTGVHRLYKTPKDYEGSLEDYAIQCGYKQLIETKCPNEEGKYYSFRWVETDDTLTTEWFEVDSPREEFFEENLDNPTE